MTYLLNHLRQVGFNLYCFLGEIYMTPFMIFVYSFQSNRSFHLPQHQRDYFIVFFFFVKGYAGVIFPCITAKNMLIFFVTRMLISSNEKIRWKHSNSKFSWSLQAMVTRYSSISTRKLSTALEILTSNKSMVAMSDYNEFHKIAKRHLLTNVLGTNAQVCYCNKSPLCFQFLLQFLLHYPFINLFSKWSNVQKQHRCHRDTMMENVSKHLHSYVKNNPLKAVNFREIFKFELFGLALKQVNFQHN